MHLSSPREIKESFPLSAEAKNFIDSSRNTVKNIFNRHDPRLLLIVGPCSIHRPDEALKYAKALKELAKEVSDYCFIIMRAYLEKPRTRQGWRGLVHDPFLDGSQKISEGLSQARLFLIQLAELGMPAATEFLTPTVAPYIEDLITWGCIGARTSSSQIHRLLASHLPMPIGFKNTIDGNIECAIDGIHVARGSHQFIHANDEGIVCQMQSRGNSYSHLILRGSQNTTNYNPAAVRSSEAKLKIENLPLRILVDCSHGNCEGNYLKQIEAFQSVKEQIQEGNSSIMGIMLESNARAGMQKIPDQLSELEAGVSITDGCIDFSITEELISSLCPSMSMSLTQS